MDTTDSSQEEAPNPMYAVGVMSGVIVLSGILSIWLQNHDLAEWLVFAAKVAGIVLLIGVVFLAVTWLIRSDIKITFWDDAGAPPSADEEDSIPHFPDTDHRTWP